MVRIRYVHVAFLVLATGCLASCGDSGSSFQPEPEGEVELGIISAYFEDQGTTYLRFGARLTNNTFRTVWYYEDCGRMWGWFQFYTDGWDYVEILNPAWGEVCLKDPVVLEPGKSVESETVWGEAWSGPDEPFRPPAGEYILRTQVFYHSGVPEEEERLNVVTRFDWEP